MRRTCVAVAVVLNKATARVSQPAIDELQVARAPRLPRPTGGETPLVVKAGQGVVLVVR